MPALKSKGKFFSIFSAYDLAALLRRHSKTIFTIYPQESEMLKTSEDTETCTSTLLHLACPCITLQT